MASLSALRTIGTAAARNIGTSGASVPLLNGANDWGEVQSLRARAVISAPSPSALYDTTIDVPVIVAADGVTPAVGAYGGAVGFARPNEATGGRMGAAIVAKQTGSDADHTGLAFFTHPSSSTGSSLVEAFTLPHSGGALIGGAEVYHADNDGPGSGLDADTVDGLHASALAQLAGAAFTGAVTLGGADAVSTSAAQTLTNKTLSGGTVSAATVTGGTIQTRIATSSETSGALSASSRNCNVHCSGNITLPASGVADGDWILLDPRGTARTISRPSGHTMYVNDVNVATATTFAHAAASAKFCGGSKWILHGVAS